MTELVHFNRCFIYYLICANSSQGIFVKSFSFIINSLFNIQIHIHFQYKKYILMPIESYQYYDYIHSMIYN